MVDVKIFATEIEKEAEKQVNELAESRAFRSEKIRVMPDAHAGKGCVVGLTSTFKDKIIPNIVGVDIACGVEAYKIDKSEIDFEKLDTVIRENVPSGQSVRSLEQKMFNVDLNRLRCIKHITNQARIKLSVGTLGGGNHFIEVDQDIRGNYWLVIHSGSRNLGKQVCEYYQSIAKTPDGLGSVDYLKNQFIERLKSDGKETLISYVLKTINDIDSSQEDDGFSYISGASLDNYLSDCDFCYMYANMNRLVMAQEIFDRMGWGSWSDKIESVHNYVDVGNEIIRKGAIAAYKNQRLIIPLNMADGCVVGYGTGNNDYNYSAPHGAGRKMSRSKARNSLRVKDYREAMDGVYSTCISSATLDESPMAYKDSQYILDGIKQTVTNIEVMKSVYNFKAE